MNIESMSRSKANLQLEVHIQQRSVNIFLVNFRISASCKIFYNQVYDVNAIKVKNVTNGSVGRPVTFLVETAQAGPGNL